MSAELLQTQRLLSMAGFSPGRLDGTPGPRTEAALSAFAARSSSGPPEAALRELVSAELSEVPILTPGLVREIAPDFPADWIQALNESLTAALITLDRAAFYLAQLAHESAGFRTLTEYGSESYFSRYDGRADLGNSQPGDGARYRGRGAIQLTGRSNYRRYGALLGVPLEEEPTIAASPLLGFRIAAEFWTDCNLNAECDRGDFTALTRRINGGLNGLSDRKRYYRRAARALADAGMT